MPNITSITLFPFHSPIVQKASFVEAKDTREKIDIVKLNVEIKEIVAREQVLRDEIDKIIAEIELSADRQEVNAGAI